MKKETRIFWSTKEVKAIAKRIHEKADSNMKTAIIVSASMKNKTGRAGKVFGLNEMIGAAQHELMPFSRIKNTFNSNDINKIKMSFVKQCSKNEAPSTQAQLPLTAVSNKQHVSLELLERKVALMKDIKSLGLPKDQEETAFAAIL